MIDWLRQLLSPEYWAVSDPGPPGGVAAALYAVLGLGFAVTAAQAAHRAWRQRDELPPARSLFLLLACSASLGLFVVAARFLRVEGLSARVWPLACLALATALAIALRWRDTESPLWLADTAAILTFRPPRGKPSTIGWIAAGLLAHSLGLASLLGLAGWPPWLAPLALVLLLAPEGIGMAATGRSGPRLAPLAPLFIAYVAGGFVWLATALDLPLAAWEGQAFPDPWRSAFHAGGLALASVAWSWAAQMARFLDKRAGSAAAVLLLAAAAVWGSAAYLGGRSRGATGSDPYAYVQMGIDLAGRGTLLHRFPLFAQVAGPSATGTSAPIAWHPLVPIGYNLPLNAAGDAASVWPPGFPILLAGAYALGGEAPVYLASPLLALLAALTTVWLAAEALDGEPPALRWGCGALAACLLLTSPEFLDRALVPMADGAAALCTTLTLIFALRLVRRGGWRPALLAGIALGAAYTVRYTQIVLALPVGLAAWASRATRTRRHWSLRLALAAGAALAVALPDLFYRWQTFGSPLATGSTELPLLGLQNVGRALQAALSPFWAAGEWGYLLPLAGLGAWWLAKRRSQESMVLGSALAAVLGVHLLYAALRLRDLISIFPLLHLATAWGVVHLLRHLAAWAGEGRRLGSAALRLALVGGCFLPLGLRSASILARVDNPGWASFGYVTLAQRAAFEQLQDSLPEGAVLGASLGAGAAHLYTGHDICRPAAWSPEDWKLFLALMDAQHRQVYLLDDGEAMPDLIHRLGARARPLTAFDLPRFASDGSPGAGWATLYQVTP